MSKRCGHGKSGMKLLTMKTLLTYLVKPTTKASSPLNVDDVRQRYLMELKNVESIESSLKPLHTVQYAALRTRAK